MAFKTRGEIRFYQFESFSQDVVHGIFTRRGGVSPQPWESLNAGGTVGDEPDRVQENRRRLFAALGRNPDTLYDVWQVHGVGVAIAETPRPPLSNHLQADVILTDRTSVTLMMRFADCVPILLYDPVRKVIGIAHAGWVGTVRGTVCIAVQAMQANYGSHPADLHAAIGPSIGPDHYEVGPDVVNQVRAAFNQDASNLVAIRDGRMYFDLWAANRLLLEQVGVTHIEVAEICTACHVDDWYSHRFEKGCTGRFGVLIGLG